MKPAVKWAVRRGKRTFTIDMLAVREQVAANTLPDADRRLIDRVLPGVLKPLAREIALGAVLRTMATPCPACGYGDHEVCKVIGHTYPIQDPYACQHCGSISVPLSRHTCPYNAGPKPDPSEPAGNAENGAAKPLKGHILE